MSDAETLGVPSGQPFEMRALELRPGDETAAMSIFYHFRNVIQGVIDDVDPSISPYYEDGSAMLAALGATHDMPDSPLPEIPVTHIQSKAGNSPFGDPLGQMKFVRNHARDHQLEQWQLRDLFDTARGDLANSPPPGITVSQQSFVAWVRKVRNPFGFEGFVQANYGLFRDEDAYFQYQGRRMVQWLKEGLRTPDDTTDFGNSDSG